MTKIDLLENLLEWANEHEFDNGKGQSLIKASDLKDKLKGLLRIVSRRPF